MKEIPLNEDGFVDFSRSFNDEKDPQFVVKVTYNTHPEGNWVPFDDYTNQTWHGPMTHDEAEKWVEDYPEDKDLKDIEIGFLNRVRPKE